jgi:CubicO group peptidase (beta-lactamase class C family)
MDAQSQWTGLDAQRLERIGDHLERNYIGNGKIAGCQVNVARHGHLAYSRSFGLMDAERGKPTADDTIYRIYSMTKPITSVALMTLYEPG